LPAPARKGPWPRSLGSTGSRPPARGSPLALRVLIDLDYQPDLDAAELLAIAGEGLGDRYEVYEAGRFQVPDVMVKCSDTEGVAIQILQGRLRKRTRLRVYPLAPSIAQRAWTPYGLREQVGRSQPLLGEVVRFLEQEPRLRARQA
jgi:hypothetical protein